MDTETISQTVALHTIVTDLTSRLIFASPEERKLKTKQLQDALTLSVDLHRNQTRQGKEPYIRHIVRVSRRLVDEYGVTDTDVIVAALLHDSVEDQFVGLSKIAGLEASRPNALAYIARRFGHRVAFLVEKLSISGDMPDEEWISFHTEHVKNIIEEDQDLFLIKLSDFSDNALRLGDISEISRRLYLSKMYLPIMRVFLEKIEGKNPLSKSQRVLLREKIEHALSEAEEFIALNDR